MYLCVPLSIQIRHMSTFYTFWTLDWILIILVLSSRSPGQLSISAYTTLYTDLHNVRYRPTQLSIPACTIHFSLTFFSLFPLLKRHSIHRTYKKQQQYTSCMHINK